MVQALRVSVAAALTLILAEWWHLPHANLAVWTTHMVMSSYTHSAFQKGVERVVGRAVGIVLGILLVNLVGELTPLVLVLEIAAMIGFFYAYFCGRLAYTYMNAGLYVNAIVMLNTADPSAAYDNGGWMFLAIVIGVVMSYMVLWLTFGESDLSIDPGPGRLWPLRGDNLARAAQMTTTMLLSQYVFFALDMPADSNTFGLFMFSVIPDLQAMIANRRAFLGGFLLPVPTAILSLLLLNRLPHLPLLVALIALAEFLASYMAQGKSRIKSVGSIFGMIYPMLIISPYQNLLSPASTFYNILSLYVFVAIAFVVGALWVTLGLVPERPTAAGSAPPPLPLPSGQK